MQRPWNLVDLPVYSLITFDEKGLNMNICTYVSAVSMNPKVYSIAVYKGTKSLENILNNEIVVLQLLSPNQANLIKYLGKKSGIDFNKHTYLKNKKVLIPWKNYEILKDVSAVIELKKSTCVDVGDHVLFILKAISYKSFSSEVLTTKYLNQKGIIRV